MNEQDNYTSEADVLRARVYGDTIPAMKLAALDKARQLYGPDAQLRIEGTGTIDTSISGEPGRVFTTTVTVRCLSLPAEDR